MIKKDCLYYEETNDMGAIVNWCKFDREIICTCSWCDKYVHKELVSVVRCKDCKYFDHSDFGKGEEYWCKRFVSSFDDVRRCHRVIEDDFCSWGERREG